MKVSAAQLERGPFSEAGTRWDDAVTYGTGPWFRAKAGVELPYPVEAGPFGGAGPNPTMGASISPVALARLECQRAGRRLAAARWHSLTLRPGRGSQAGAQLANCRWHGAPGGGRRRGMGGFFGDLVGSVAGPLIDWISGKTAKEARAAREQARAMVEAEELRLQQAIVTAESQAEHDAAVYQLAQLKGQQTTKTMLVGGGVLLAAIAVASTLRRGGRKKEKK